MKRSLVPVIALLLLSACFTSGARMTSDTYDNIQMGTPIASVEKEIGKPYAVRSKGFNTKEYEYIERIDMGNNLVAENHYFLVVTDGQVVGKYITREKPPAYDLIYQEDPNWSP
jgi:hypothetical protein